MGGKRRSIVGDKKAGQDRFKGFKRRNLRGWDKGRGMCFARRSKLIVPNPVYIDERNRYALAFARQCIHTH